MEITKTHREQAELTATEVQIRLYDSEESGEVLWSIAIKFGLTEQKRYFTFTRMVGDVILGFYKITDLRALIQYTFQSLDQRQQELLEVELKKFLAPLFPESELSLERDIIEVEKITHSIEGLRTMAGDVKALHSTEVPTHQSTQADILGRTTPEVKVAAPLPTAPNTDARWETDSRY